MLFRERGIEKAQLLLARSLARSRLVQFGLHNGLSFSEERQLDPLL